MDPLLSDLVVDTRLDAVVSASHTIQARYVSNPAIGQRRTRLEENWHRTKELGRGTFGVVWLETCVAGPSLSQLRAVKEIRKDGDVSTFYRELDAVARFSQERVRIPSNPLLELPDHFISRITSTVTILFARSAGTKAAMLSLSRWNTSRWATWRA